MKRFVVSVFLIINWSFAPAQTPYALNNYFPSPNKWEIRSPSVSGFDSIKLNLAIRFAIDNEVSDPRSMEQNQQRSFGKEPLGEAIGPFADRGDPAGLIIHKGYIIAQWGDPSRVDMTHSVTKSFLSTVVGLAADSGLIRDVNDRVALYVPHPIMLYSPSETQMFSPFNSVHNSKLNWDVMLRQTSDWEGTLWGKPDWADRPDRDSTKWLNRLRNEPGTVWEYNDVRVNALALAATWVWRQDLPSVLEKYIMDPIGASDTWKWHGYRNSWIRIDTSIVPVVSGGGHWGGGMFINAYDMGRFGLLTLHEGNWNGRQLISKKWIGQSLTPTSVRPTYGYMNFFLNTDRKNYPSAPASAFVHVGNGTNIIYVDREHDLVMVVRWIKNNAIDGFIKKVQEAMQ